MMRYPCAQDGRRFFHVTYKDCISSIPLGQRWGFWVCILIPPYPKWSHQLGRGHYGPRQVLNRKDVKKKAARGQPSPAAAWTYLAEWRLEQGMQDAWTHISRRHTAKGLAHAGQHVGGPQRVWPLTRDQEKPEHRGNTDIPFGVGI